MASKTPTAPPQRIDTHRTDTMAIRFLQSLLPADWIERSVDDRDYGADMLLEQFDGKAPTGNLVLLQVKGTEATFGSEPVSFAAPVKTLIYARMFHAPFFLVHVSVADRKAYFVWLQKYIDVVLTSENPTWDTQGDVTIHFPGENDLSKPKGFEKLNELVKSLIHRDLGITFMRHFAWLERSVDGFHDTRDVAFLDEALVRTQEISKLEPFLAVYAEFGAEIDTVKFDAVIQKTKAYGEFDYGDADIVDEQIKNMRVIQGMFLNHDEAGFWPREPDDVGFPY